MLFMTRWDLDKHCSNSEWRLLTWVFNNDLWTNSSVFTNLFVIPESRLVVASTKDSMVLIKCCTDTNKKKTTVVKTEGYQQPWQDVIRRLIP